jgi:glycosyltransferase involved in cell wall biosynthesis
MKIAINALGAKVGGGITYLNRLLFHLSIIDEENTYFLFVAPYNREKIITFSSARFNIINVKVKNVFHRMIYEQIAIPYLLKKLSIDIIYIPGETAPLFTKLPSIVALQNLKILMPLGLDSSLGQRTRLWLLRKLAMLSFRKAKRIIFVSQSSYKYAERILGINAHKASVIYHGIELDRFSPTRPLRIPKVLEEWVGKRKYVLFLSTLAQHKNVETLLEAYAGLDKELRSSYPLVLVGKKVQPYFSKLSQLVYKLDLNEEVLFTDEVPYEEVPSYYRGAILFVLPSFRETFGMPVLEAMASGVPVIASNIPAFSEIVGEAGLLFNPTDPDELRDKMHKVLTDQYLRDMLITKGLSKAKEFSWETTARRTLQVLNEAFEEGKR